ncbi:MAG TPA: cytochrome C oxidase assembly protein, partial [bacterium]|nr:cytochrome C oxidase assembly protein [bacterium]
MMLAHALLVLQVTLGSVLVLLGSLAEGYGYGLSLGTAWPYRRDILRLALRADPEAWHRIVATVVGLNAIALALALRSPGAWLGLALSAAAALL